MPGMRTVRQFMAFTGVGAVGTAGHYLTLVLLVEALHRDPVLSTSMGFVVGAMINYILNYKYTFSSNKAHHETLFRFLLVALIGALINSGIMYVGTTLWSVNYLLTQIVATGIVLVQNFTLNKLWTFSESEEIS